MASKHVWFAILCAFGIGPVHAAEVGLTLLTEISPPMNVQENGKMVGPSSDTVREMMQRTGLPFIIHPMPWKRALLQASQLPKTCVYPTTRTPEREATFKWIGPIGATEWILFAAANKKMVLNSVEQARPYLIGTYLGDSRDDYFRANGYRVDSVSDDSLNPKKLLANRIDLWAASASKGALLLADELLREKIVPVLRFNRVDLYLACHHELPPQMLESLDGALKKMQADGTAKAIADKYPNLVAK